MWPGEMKISFRIIVLDLLVCLIKKICYSFIQQWSEVSHFSRSVVSDSLLPMDWSMPGLPVHHQLAEPTQTHVPSVGDAMQPSHPLSSSSPPDFNLSKHQGLFERVSSSHHVAKSIAVSASASVLIFKTNFL